MTDLEASTRRGRLLSMVMHGGVDAGLRRVVQISTSSLLAGVTLVHLMVDGVRAVPVLILLLDLIAALSFLVPWHRLPRDAFVLVGASVALVVAAVVPAEDPIRGRVVALAVLSAAAVSRRTALLMGLLGAIVAIVPLGARDPAGQIASALVALFVAVVVPGLIAAARTPHREPIAPSALNDYIAVLAHEVSTPIVSIGAAAQILAKDLHGRTTERNALAIAEEARQVYSLLESLSDLSALESGRLRLSVRPFDIASLVRGGFGLVEFGERRLVVDVPDEPVVVQADDRRIRQVLRNLLANAVKYSAPGTRVEVRVGRTVDRRSAIVQVEDHGPGVPPGERGRLFQKFARLSTAGGTRGSGLGLYLSQAIVADHGGELWGEWPARGGSIFSFTLPLASVAAARSAEGALSG